MCVCACVRVCVRGAYGVGHTLESGRRNLEKYFFLIITMRVEQDFEHEETSENSVSVLCFTDMYSN